MNRRSFLGALGAPIVVRPALFRPSVGEIARDLAAHPGTPAETARDESFWRHAQSAFGVDRSLVNLNNGGVSPSPLVVQESMARHLAYANSAPAYTMWRHQAPRREGVRTRLAMTFGCDPEELAITRNTSESLQTCQFGFDLAPGDEVLTTTHDYPRMISTWKQRERRDGIVLRQFSLPVPLEDPRDVVRGFEEHLTDRTRLILVSHVVFLTGQVLPVRDVVRLGRQRGIPVLVDGAHAFAHIPYERDDLECDYYATSLHKWLFAPFGTGFLYVQRDRIEPLWSLMGSEEGQADDIRKFEEIGTHPIPPILAIHDALTYHEGLGIERKYARLVALRDRWADALGSDDRVRLATDLGIGRAGGIATVGIDGIAPGDLAAHLLREHQIIVTPIQHEEVEGIRVSPGVYTTPEEIDRFVDAMQDVLANGIPG